MKVVYNPETRRFSKEGQKLTEEQYNSIVSKAGLSKKKYVVIYTSDTTKSRTFDTKEDMFKFAGTLDNYDFLFEVNADQSRNLIRAVTSLPSYGVSYQVLKDIELKYGAKRLD